MRNKIIITTIFIIASIILAHFVFDLAAPWSGYIRVQHFNPFWVKFLTEDDYLMFDFPNYYIVDKLNIIIIIVIIVGMIRLRERSLKIKLFITSTIIFILSTLYTYYVYLELSKYINSVDMQDVGSFYFVENRSFLHVILQGGDANFTISYIPYAILVFAFLMICYMCFTKNNEFKKRNIEE